jgi:hypothetical protein
VAVSQLTVAEGMGIAMLFLVPSPDGWLSEMMLAAEDAKSCGVEHEVRSVPRRAGPARRK